MNEENYIKKLVASFRKNHFSQYVFIKYYNTLTISDEEIYKIVVDETPSLDLVFYSFPIHSMQGSFKPFLGGIRELYFKYFKKEPLEEFVEKAGVYSLLRPVFVNYIRSGVGGRTEDILITEVEFEQEQVLRSIVNVYNYIAESRPIFVFLEKLHLANASCIQLLHYMITSGKLKNVQILGMYNEVYRIKDYISSYWEKFISEMEKRNLQYGWKNIKADSMVASRVASRDFFAPESAKIEEYIYYGVNMYYFLTFDDAKYYMEIIYDQIKQGFIELKGITKAKFFQVFTLILIMKNEYTRAIQMCEIVGSIAKELEDDWISYNYYYLGAMCQYGMDQLANKVEFYVQKCQEIARKYKDELAEYKPEVIRMLSNYNYWRDVFEKRYSYRISEDFLEKAERFGFDNILCHVCVLSLDESDMVEKMRKGLAEETYFNRGVEIAKRLENYQFLISAYTKNIVLFSELGCHDIVDELYRRKLEVLEKSEAHLSRRVHTYNGLGYNAGIAEKYQLAEEYFSKSLEANLLLKDGEETAITLYNSSINKILAREYEGAIEDLDLLLQIMDMLHIHSIKICDTSRIYGFLALCSFYVGEEYRCHLCLNRIDFYVDHLEHVEDGDKYRYWNGTLFLKYLIHGMIYTQEGHYEEAEKEFQKACRHQEADIGNRYFNYPMYVVEVARLYEKSGRMEERRRVLEEGIDFCRSRGYHLREQILLNLLQNKSENGEQTAFPPRSVSKQQILETVENMAIKNNYEMNKRDIEFMVVWQDLMSKDLSVGEMLSQAISMMKNYFNLDGVVMLSKKSDIIGQEYFEGPESNGTDTSVTDCIRNLSQEERNAVFEYFQKRKHALLTSRVDKDFLKYRPLLEQLDFHHIITLYGYPMIDLNGEVTSVILGYVEMRKSFIGNRYLLQEQDFVILQFFSSQLYRALERLEYMDLINRMNSQLRDMAVTDLLTGLYNRQGFERKLSERGMDKDEESVFIYIDLDNFKYYNDTFGHEVGDFVLVRFAQLLERVADGIGYAVRYGGDEFVIVLCNKDIEFGKRVAKNIFFMMSDSFNAIIEKQIGEEHKIPKEKRLSCSAGISACKGSNPQQVQEALNNADKGLYYVKKTTKSNYVVWDEIKDFV